MNKIKKLLLCSFLIGGLSSCVVYDNHTVTGLPIGSKIEMIKGNTTVQEVAKKGGISKIGSVQVRWTNYILYTKKKTTVTGE